MTKGELGMHMITPPIAAFCLVSIVLTGSLHGSALRTQLDGQPVGIEIAVTPPSGTIAYAVEEALPPNVTPREISHGGVFDSHAGKVKWGPFFDDEGRELTFSIPGTEGILSLVGEVSYGDSPATFVTGNTEVALPDLDSYFSGWQHLHLPINIGPYPGDHVASGATLPLLAQYAMGRVPNASGSPFAAIFGDSGPEVRFVRDLRRTDVAIQVERSEDLGFWYPWDPESVDTEMLNENVEEIRFSADDESFYRLRFVPASRD